MLVADRFHLGVSDLPDIESEGRRCCPVVYIQKDMRLEVHTRHSEESCQTDTALAVRRYYPVGCNQLGTDRWVVHRHRPEV